MFSLDSSVKDEVFISEMISVIAGNFVVRIIGAIIRSWLIMLALICALVTIAGMMIALLLWMLLPVLCVTSFYFLIVTLLK